MIYESFQTYQQSLRSGEYSCEKAVGHFLSAIELHKDLNAFLDVYATEALENARRIDLKIQERTAGRLAGMVIGIKDVLAYQDHGLQAGSRILNGFKSQFTATAIQRLIDEDAIIIGRQNCDEFAMGSSNENSAFGPVRNFADTSRVPGGSSGGSAVAVQAGLCHASIGSDTGGSVRQPAAFCGVTGLKPSYSRISRWGLAAYASSFDCVGTVTGNVSDAALLLEIMAGSDAYDSTVSTLPVPAYSHFKPLNKSLKIGYFKEALESEGLDPEVRKLTFDRIEKLKEDGHTIVPVDFPLMKYILPTYYILTTAEASSNLSRYDGIRYGYRTPATTDLNTLYKKTRAEGFGPEVKRRIMLGTFVLSADYYDAYYTKAQRVRNLIRRETERILKEVDFLVSPTTPSPAFRIGEKSEDQLQMFLTDIFTVHANVVGFPALSLPNGKSSEGMPVGFQILGSNFKETDLLDFAFYLENNK